MCSVIIVSFNTCELLKKCLLSLQKFEPQSEVIVVDNASKDDSVQMVKREFPEVKVLPLDRNSGFAAANNSGLALATKDYVVLLNSDTELLDSALSCCVARLEANPKLGAIHPLLKGMNGEAQQCQHSFPSLRSVASKAVGKGSAPLSENEPTWLAGTALVIRKTALDQIGGLDSGYFMYWEDADLSARLRRNGWDLAVEQSTTILHYGGASGGGPDAARRADLYAWYCFGKHRWFTRNRPTSEALAVWLLDVVDVPRKFLRGLRYSNRRQAEWAHASVTARVLALRLLGLSPATP
jgi:N-acetylglucosaminyl-diphospho-decaprenol L-rhamnosyltransferase